MPFSVSTRLSEKKEMYTETQVTFWKRPMYAFYCLTQCINIGKKRLCASLGMHRRGQPRRIPSEDVKKKQKNNQGLLIGSS